MRNRRRKGKKEREERRRNEKRKGGKESKERQKIEREWNRRN